MKPLGPSGPVPDVVATSFKDVSNAILKPYGCVNCHGWALKEEGLNRRVKPGDPDSSRIFLKIENGDMPPAGRAVTTKDMEVLRNYINDLVSM